MNYIFESGKRRRVMHIQSHSTAGEPLWGDRGWVPLCGDRRQVFNRAINAPFGLGRRICRACLNALPGGSDDA